MIAIKTMTSAASETVEVVAAQAGKKIYVHGYLISTDTDASFTFKGATTQVWPKLFLGANGGTSELDKIYQPMWLFETVAGVALNLVGSVASNAEVIVFYEVR